MSRFILPQARSSSHCVLQRRPRAIQVLANGVYLAAMLEVEADRQTCEFPDLDAAVRDLGEMFGNGQLLAQLRQQLKISYRAAYQKLIDAANHNLTPQLKNGFRMEGHMASASLDRVLLLADGISIVLRASGELKILYGL